MSEGQTEMDCGFLNFPAGPGPAAAAAPPAGAPGAAPEADKAVDDLEKRFPFMKQSGVVPKIQNVVAMFSLGTRLDLKHIGLHAKNAEYNPKRFAAVIMRIREPKTTALIFESGKVVVTGASDEDASKRASKRFAKIIVKLGYEAKFKDFKVQNIVGSTGGATSSRFFFFSSSFSFSLVFSCKSTFRFASN